MKTVRSSVFVTLMVIVAGVRSSTIVDNPGALRVVGSLGPVEDTLLGYQPPLSMLFVNARHMLFGPPRLYVAAAHLDSKNGLTALGPIEIATQSNKVDSTTEFKIEVTSSPPVTTVKYPSVETSSVQTEQVTTVNPSPVSTERPQQPVSPPLPRRLIPALSPAASEANFPSSQAQSSTDSKSLEPNDKESAVAQIEAYSKPVDIPASGRALFSTMNVADGSYHFGYDTGSGQHQSYREERRFPGGRVEGRYGYVDPDGVLRIVEYTADQRGYRSRLTTRNLGMARIPIIGPIPAPLIANARKNASMR